VLKLKAGELSITDEQKVRIKAALEKSGVGKNFASLL
jgi:hypothetical protein